MLQIMTYEIPYIEQSRTQNIDAPISLYGLAGVMVEDIYYNSI